MKSRDHLRTEARSGEFSCERDRERESEKKVPKVARTKRLCCWIQACWWKTILEDTKAILTEWYSVGIGNNWAQEN